MPLIRYTYPKDVAEHGQGAIEVSWVVAHTEVVQRRRAVLVDLPAAAPVPAEEPAPCASCPGSGCADCPLR